MPSSSPSSPPWSRPCCCSAALRPRRTRRPERPAASVATKTHTHPAGKPTVVLVHGGWADSSGWNDEITALKKKGYPVIAPGQPAARPDLGRRLHPQRPADHRRPDRPGRPLLRRRRDQQRRPRCRQRRGAGLHRRVRSRHRGVPGPAGHQNPGTHITPDALDARPYPLPDGGQGVDLYIKASVFREAFAGDLPRKTTRLMQATQRPFSETAFTEPSGEPAWKTVPSWYLVATDDHAIPPVTQGSWPSAPAPTWRASAPRTCRCSRSRKPPPG